MFITRQDIEFFEAIQTIDSSTTLKDSLKVAQQALQELSHAGVSTEDLYGYGALIFARAYQVCNFDLFEYCKKDGTIGIAHFDADISEPCNIGLQYGFLVCKEKADLCETLREIVKDGTEFRLSPETLAKKCTNPIVKRHAEKSDNLGQLIMTMILSDYNRDIRVSPRTARALTL